MESVTNGNQFEMVDGFPVPRPIRVSNCMMATLKKIKHELQPSESNGLLAFPARWQRNISKQSDCDIRSIVSRAGTWVALVATSSMRTDSRRHTRLFTK